MFQRRTPRTRRQTVAEMIWPSMGWLRAAKYVRHRLVRLSASTYSIASGFACGAVAAFSPLLGTHFIQALIFAWLVRGNYLSAMVGTFFGNPWSYPVFFLIDYEAGQKALSLLGMTGFRHPAQGFTLASLMEDPWGLLAPMMLGSALSAILLGPVLFALFYVVIATARNARERARLAQVEQVAHELTDRAAP